MSQVKNRAAIKAWTGGRAKRHVLLLLWGALFSLVVADGLITEFLISQRLAWESNPFLADLVGESGFLVLKFLGATLAVFILWDISRRHRWIALAATCFFVFIYTLIVFWNLFVLFLEI